VRADTVIVTGVGGPAGVAVVRDLRGRGHHVVGVDCDPLAAGLHLASDGAVVPRFDDAGYVDELCRLADKHGPCLLVSTLAEEMASIAAASDALTAAGCRTWVPRAEAVRACIDKWEFAQVLERNGIAGPATALGSSASVQSPWIVKPRFGRGSRDVFVAMTERELAYALDRVEQPIVQHRVRGREFTVDALVDRDGALAGAVPRWRIETKAGISVKGETFAAPDLVAGVAGLLRTLGLTGPANVQGFASDTGAFTFIEVNPRFSGALPLSIAAGADLVGEFLRGIRGKRVRPERLQYRPGVRMIRYFEEVFVE
jgi:carbamoyl-phosphate synthase large subunit